GNQCPRGTAVPAESRPGRFCPERDRLRAQGNDARQDGHDGLSHDAGSFGVPGRRQRSAPGGRRRHYGGVVGDNETERVMAVSADRIAITPAERRAAIIDVIASARSRLILSLFRCDDFGVLDALVAALARGVRIEALMTDRAKGGRKRLDQISKMLASSGA